ncbi:hypothetical protein CAEBREN_18094 [Caenorhabditis brenneri]|uniref:Uncharacterized protein n=1 Tax=Caenorhabditis brenneri TaxID=135651 RepID=G0MBX5_CAEBE|nr:hypothetical protein CAEBREN_18094 [Caenorhabditis brenneri]
MAQMNQEEIIQQFDPEMRAKIRREAELRDEFWRVMKAHRARVYPTFEERRDAVLAINVIFTEVNDLAADLMENGYIPPPHPDQPPAAETENDLEALRRVTEVLREMNERRQRNEQQQQPPQNEDTSSEEENGNNQN